MISKYERQYINIVQNILDNGYYDQNRTSLATYKLPHQIIQVDLQKEFPILKSKFVAFKTAVKEMLWIYQKQSNIVQDLRDKGVKIWNEWEGEDGTIGKAYGYQVKKFNQMDNLIEALKNNPQDRRMMINLWNWSDLPEMNLAPCCFLTMWDVTNGKLNCMLVQRSGDVPLGVPFNTTQFAVLTHMLAQVCGLKVGLLTHVINNAHIYQNQVDGMKEQLNRFIILNGSDVLSKGGFYLRLDNKGLDMPIEKSDLKYEEVLSSKPILKLNLNITNFYDFTPEDIILEDYKHMGKIDMPVSV
jgi:thymidylate synthase